MSTDQANGHPRRRGCTSARGRGTHRGTAGRGPYPAAVLRRSVPRRGAPPADRPGALAQPGQREAARAAGRRAAHAPGRVSRGTVPGVLRQGGRVRRVGRHRHHPAAGRLVAHPGHDPAGMAGRRGRAAERSPAAAPAGPGDPQGPRHDPRAVPGRRWRPSCWSWWRSRRGGRGRWPPSRCSWRSRSRAGRRARRSPAGAELPAEVQPPTQDVIVRALGSLGIAEVNKSLTAGTFPPLPSPGPRGRARLAGRG